LFFALDLTKLFLGEENSEHLDINKNKNFNNKKRKKQNLTKSQTNSLNKSDLQKYML
jgi:hypothetical protein